MVVLLFNMYNPHSNVFCLLVLVCRLNGKKTRCCILAKMKLVSDSISKSFDVCVLVL